MRFLINGKRKGRTMRSIRRHGKAVGRAAWKASGFTRNAPKKRKRRKLTGAALAAHLKKLHQKSKRHTSRTGTARRVARHAAASRRNTMKRKKHTVRRARRSRRRASSRRYASNPVVRRRRSRSRRRFARNPSSVKGLVAFGVQGLKDAAGVVVGKAAARAIPQMVGLHQDGVAGYAIQGLAAIAAGFAASKFLGANVGRMVLAGGLAAPLETAVKALNIPVISGALGAYPLAAYPLAGITDTGAAGMDAASLAALGSGMGYDGDEMMM